MVGIFSRFSVSRNGHRRSQSALGDREAIPPNSDATSGAAVTGGTTAAAHGIEVAIEFKPLEHPPEPLDNDRPIQCPLPEPSILNVGMVPQQNRHRGATVSMVFLRAATLCILPNVRMEGYGRNEYQQAAVKGGLKCQLCRRGLA